MSDETMNQVLEICTKKINHLVEVVQAKESSEVWFIFFLIN
jgi:hypothetical protein